MTKKRGNQNLLLADSFLGYMMANDNDAKDRVICALVAGALIVEYFIR